MPIVLMIMIIGSGVIIETILCIMIIEMIIGE